MNSYRKLAISAAVVLAGSAAVFYRQIWKSRLIRNSTWMSAKPGWSSVPLSHGFFDLRAGPYVVAGAAGHVDSGATRAVA